MVLERLDLTGARVCDRIKNERTRVRERIDSAGEREWVEVNRHC